jgi:phage-related protein (TIGR01555 family)
MDLPQVLSGSFQQVVSDGTVKSADGKSIAWASDAKPPVKFAHDGFAMDAPSAGNPLSMKPLIEPVSMIPGAQLCWYAGQGFIGYQLAGMISQHWLIDKACTMPARDAMRHGFDITVNEKMKETDGDEDKGAEETEENQDYTDIIAYINKLDKKFGIKQNCVEFVRFNRMFGIRVALPIIETTEKDFYEKPFNIDGVKPGSYKGISQIDPYWITPELNFEAAANPASVHFYEPTWWRVNGQRIHRSHLVIIRNGQVADILKPTYLYGGISVPQKIYERVYAAERTANEAPQLALTKRSTVFKMDITQAAANPQAFREKMEFFAFNRDNYGAKTIGLEDEAEQFDTTLTDVDSVIMTQYQIVAAASGVPSTKLLGTSPKGFDATGEFETDSYHEELETIQMNDMQPLIERHHALLMKSEIEPKFGKTFEIDIVWNAVDTPGAKEMADINYVKAQTDAQLVTTGAVDGTDVRNRIIADKESGYNGIEAVVDGGPGDRQHEQEMEQEMLERGKSDETKE